MRYMLLICATEGEDVPAGDSPGGMTIEEWVEEYDRRGIRIQGDRFAEPSDATTVRVRGGEVMLTDGPFADTKERIAGYDLLECADLDEAIEVASKHPMAREGMVEVRPFWTG
jgi:hypothetical protein